MLSCIALAGFHAGAAGGGTLLAVVMIMFAALVGALLANFNALAHDVLGVSGAAGNEGGSEAADIGAVAVEANTGHHHLDIFFAQASVRAHFAGGDAAAEGVKRGLSILVLGGVGAGLIHDE
ncbi:hypothetical protein GCM10011375_30260 [Hymenobacter qilianensis]|uniref:Uncharacterized protein n=1 Tax=Hymenobacter qilianensis TaxID=1385715 RepID=A0ACB5PUF1_9BACT|nr:hypothetical protein GCM10011375_30260 [Hymenobacter qilianensis]